MDHIKAEEYDKNPILDEEVEPNNNLKNFLINHVGGKIKPDDDNVTVEMIVETIAEENFIRGYQQALDDVETGKKIAEEQERASVKKKSCKLCEK